MRFKEKIFVFVLLLVFLNLAFLFGQIFYYSREIDGMLNRAPRPFNSNLSANLLKAAAKNFTLLIDDKELPVDSTEFNNWIEKYTRDYSNLEEYRINEKSVRIFLKNLSMEMDVPPTNARFQMVGGKITEFVPSQMGHVLNIPETFSNIITALAQDHPDRSASQMRQGVNQKSAKNNLGIGTSDANQIKSRAVMDDVRPNINLEKINDLGIENLLGHGESAFTDSPGPRVNNIQVSAKIFNDILVKPGEEFSFTQLLGSVDAAGGYKPEHVIKNGKIILEYGGGICQVSTTLFRAAVFAGLPILERHPHSLPVRYYNPQGFDATVYPGSADLRFKNDTPAYILIQSKISGSKLSFDIYGTDDKRKVAVVGPRQYDISSNGSLKAELSRTVTYPDGTKKEDIFRSSYQSPSLFPTVRNPLE